MSSLSKKKNQSMGQIRIMRYDMLLLYKIIFIDLNFGQVTGYKTFSKFPKTSKHNCSCPNFRIVREVGYH